MTYAIKLGNTGIDVKKMQYYLNTILYKPTLQKMPEDGIYGETTEFAVAVFQYVYNMRVDGIIGTNTWDRILLEFKKIPNPTPETNFTTRTLSVGNTGLAVQKMQEYLNRLVTLPSPLLPDGVFGNVTRNAVLKFQITNNLSADGVIGNRTWDRIIAQI